MDLGAVKVWVEKQNYVLSLIWGTFSRQNGCVTQNVFLHYSWLLLTCMIKWPHQRKYRGLLKSSFLLLASLWSRAVTLELMLILTYKVRKLTITIQSLVVIWSDLWQNSRKSGRKVKTSVSFLFFKNTSSFLPGNGSHGNSDVTELSNSQLKMVQFISSTSRCKRPSL